MWFDVEDGHFPTVPVDLSDGVKLGPVHTVLVSPVLEVLVGCNVRHHLVLKQEEKTNIIADCRSDENGKVALTVETKK